MYPGLQERKCLTSVEGLLEVSKVDVPLAEQCILCRIESLFAARHTSQIGIPEAIALSFLCALGQCLCSLYRRDCKSCWVSRLHCKCDRIGLDVCTHDVWPLWTGCSSRSSYKCLVYTYLYIYNRFLLTDRSSSQGTTHPVRPYPGLP